MTLSWTVSRDLNIINANMLYLEITTFDKAFLNDDELFIMFNLVSFEVSLFKLLINKVT